MEQIRRRLQLMRCESPNESRLSTKLQAEACHIVINAGFETPSLRLSIQLWLSAGGFSSNMGMLFFGVVLAHRMVWIPPGHLCSTTPTKWCERTRCSCKHHPRHHCRSVHTLVDEHFQLG